MSWQYKQNRWTKKQIMDWEGWWTPNQGTRPIPEAQVIGVLKKLGVFKNLGNNATNNLSAANTKPNTNPTTLTTGVLTVCDHSGMERPVAWSCTMCGKQHWNPKVLRCVTCKHPQEAPPTPSPALPNKVAPMSTTNWAQYATPGRKEKLNTLGISLSNLETKVFAQETNQPMDLDSKQLPNQANNQKMVDLQNEIHHMEKGGYTTINNPHVAHLYQQMEALKPTPSKELRTRSQVIGELASLEKSSEADAKIFSAKTKALQDQNNVLEKKNKNLPKRTKSKPNFGKKQGQRCKL